MVFAEVEGGLEAQSLDNALDAVQAEHPLLRARITEIRGRRWFKPAPSLTPPLRADVLPLEGWRNEVERQFRVPFDTGQALLARFTWFKGEGRSVLALTLHHSAGDGRSGAWLLLDIIRRLKGEHETRFRAPRPSAQSLDPIHDKPVLDRALTRARFWLGRRKDAMRSATSFPGYRKAAGGERRIRVRALDHPLHLPALRKLARKRGTTVQGVLGSALLRAIHEQTPDPGACDLALTSLADLRGSLKGGLAWSDLGMYSATLTTVHRVGQAEFWDLARDIGHAVAKAVKGGTVNLIHEIYPGSRGLSHSRGLGKLVRNLAASSPPAAMLTNLGQVAATHSPELNVTSLGFAVSPPPQNPICVCVASCGDQLTLTLAYDERSLDGVMAGRIGAGMVAQLEEATRSPQSLLLSSVIE